MYMHRMVKTFSADTTKLRITKCDTKSTHFYIPTAGPTRRHWHPSKLLNFIKEYTDLFTP